MRNAARVGIETASALKMGDRRIKVVIERVVIAKRLSVDSMRVILHPFTGQPPEVDLGWKVDQLSCDNLPVINWISELSRKLILESEDAKQITFRCTFQPHAGWTYNGRGLFVGALELFFTCSKKWFAQTVREDVTLGSYDHLRRKVTIPNKQVYALGPIHRDAWVEIESGPEEKELEPNTFELYHTLLNHIPPIGDAKAPQIEELIAEKKFVFSSSEGRKKQLKPNQPMKSTGPASRLIEK